jgi:hypothetical protein
LGLEIYNYDPKTSRENIIRSFFAAAYLGPAPPGTIAATGELATWGVAGVASRSEVVKNPCTEKDMLGKNEASQCGVAPLACSSSSGTSPTLMNCTNIILQRVLRLRHANSLQTFRMRNLGFIIL